MSQNTTLDMSFPTLKYNGADFFWSRNIAAGEAYFLRPETDFNFWIQADANFKLSPFQKAWNQDLYGASLLLMCAFFTRRRMFSMRITGILV